MFAKSPSLNIRFTFAVIVSLLFIVCDYRFHQLDAIRNILSVVAYPVQYIVGVPSRLNHQFKTTFISFQQLQEQNRALKRQKLIDKTRLLRFVALEKENIRLRALLEHSFTMGEHVLVAELIEVNMDPYKHNVIVDKGLRFGVNAGQPVFDSFGVIGQVTRAMPLNSEVILITDPGHAIPVTINRNDVRTIAIGSGQNSQLSLPYLPNNADVKPGDLLVTSGLGGKFPSGYPVATIDKVTTQPDKPFLKITANASAHLNRSRELLIVWSDQTPVAIDPQIGQSTPITSNNSVSD
ncbi:MAG: rod shape-determining protein MreC [Methylococcales bacterium]